MSGGVLVTGAGGQLGRELAHCAPLSPPCVALDRRALDLRDPAAIGCALDAYKPQAVINAAAYTAVDRAEAEPAQADASNATAPGLLAAACAERGIRLLHVSTDFVFDGRASSPYAPDAAPAPLGAYGRSKLAGEDAVRTAQPDVLVLRTGWVYSRHGGNFVKTMLRLMAEREELTVVADQVGTPTWARGLARALWSFAGRPALVGTYHFSDAGVASWYDFAVAIGEEAETLGLLARVPRILPVPTAAYPTPARRPAYSVLDKSACWRDLAMEGVHWRRQLRLMLQDFKEHGV
ncbi:dTDP-4-dehydrorhamnose reductase [Pseudohaliea rubra]|uniref:dTDP-4-dehydrorhamnose reductase n=1 Tax=Pseudohaliea rubra DSM 19751 TaxID=1265313 RepID=A0A095VUQ0_9GAMM|nr:dTDP-4-dehydrorhamnose reductase [Pseudohaliea rubra]KGE04803.1 dTDP-4-dehydrorhamnose reductase [Pseudohaliea rubra DSM 19751]